MANFRETPWQRIIEVGWGGQVVIVEVTAMLSKPYQVVTILPPDEVGDDFAGSSVGVNDYKTYFILKMDITGNTGEVVVLDEITDVWDWDSAYIGGLGDDAINNAAVAAQTAVRGYPPAIHLVGQQVKLNQLNAPFGQYTLGENAQHTHPFGDVTKYKNGYIALSRGPQYAGGQPFGDFDYSFTESWYWYQIVTIPGYNEEVRRKSFLVNFRSNFTISAELIDIVAVEHPLLWSIKGYSSGVSFTIANGIMTPNGAVPAIFSASGSVAGGHSGRIRAFNGQGFI